MGEDIELKTIRSYPEVKARVGHWRDGKLIDSWEHGGDVVTNFGRNWLCNKAAGSLAPGKQARLAWSALGTCQKVPAGSITKFGAQMYRGTVAYSKDSAVGSASLDRTFSIGSTYAIRSSALIGTSTGGTLYCYGTFPVKNVNGGDQITLNYTLGLS